MVSGTILLDHNCSTIAAGSKVAVRMDMLLVEDYSVSVSAQSQPLWGVEISGTKEGADENRVTRDVLAINIRDKLKRA
ncbi:hypothetical protein CsSME_00019599 [Camellia sinensis var. sinensis]